MIYFYFESFFKEFLSSITPVKKEVSINFPYFSQWESFKLVDAILNKTMKASEDPQWKRSGAINKLDYAYWSWNICGMACLKMILEYKKIKNYPLVMLAKKCETYGGYIPREKTIDGLFYKPFCTFVKNEFGLTAHIAPILSLRRIKSELSKGNFVIASVNPGIRNIQNETPLHKNGHLILITGYNAKKKTIRLHNPSGYFKKSQEQYEISENDFLRFFGSRGIIISNS